MAASSRTSAIVPITDHVDSTWHLVNKTDKLDSMEKNKHAGAVHLPSVRHRRGQTERTTRHSMFRMRSRSRTVSNLSIGHSFSPSASIESEDPHHQNIEATCPESGWSDSDQSDSMTKSWVVKGSKMLKKQNSKFNLSSSKRSSLVEELDEASEQYPNLHSRGNSKHGRMWSTSSGRVPYPLNVKSI